MLESSSSLLIVTDIQGKLAEAMFDKTSLFKQTGIMIDGCRILGIPVLWLEQYPRGLGPTVPEVARHLEGLAPLAKNTFSSLRDPAVNARFESFNRTQVLLIGIETHVCIYQTAMDLLARGIEAHVVADAVSSRTKANREIGLKKIERAGGHITSVETALFELLGAAEGDAFKRILSLVK
ncbi:hydrolase [Candidatus Latescibacterota bacterium]